MVRPAAALPFTLACAAAAFLAAGCSDSSSSTSTTAEYPTLLTVDPSLFRGAVTCGAPGLEQYVATVTDISVDRDQPVTSSGPTPCQSVVSFGEPIVALYHLYTVVIDGYDRADIKRPEIKENEPAPDKRQMVDGSNNPVAPAWITTCGQWPLSDSPDAAVDEDAAMDQDADLQDDAASTGLTPYMRLRFPTRAIGSLEVIVRGCIPLVASPQPDASAPDASSALPTKKAPGDEPGVQLLAPPLARTGSHAHDVDGGGPNR